MPRCGQDQLDVTQAQAEAVIEPDRVLDDLSRKAEATIRVQRQVHDPKAAMADRSRQPDNAVADITAAGSALGAVPDRTAGELCDAERGWRLAVGGPADYGTTVIWPTRFGLILAGIGSTASGHLAGLT